MTNKIRFAYRQIFAALLTAVLVTGCATAPTPRGPGPVVERPDIDPNMPPVGEVPDDQQDPDGEPDTDGQDPDDDTGLYANKRDGLTPPHMQGREIKRLALLLPFSARSDRLREEANSMLQAAELALFDRAEPDILLIALDTKGTSAGAESATKAALGSGADVILGPILAGSVRAASREAQKNNTPVIAFSNDRTTAGDGTYLLSVLPEAEIARIVDYVAENGATRFAFLGPENAYGQRVQQAYQGAVRRNGGEVTASETYDGRDISVMQTPAQKLATFHKKREAESKAAIRAGRAPLPLAYDAIILPEGGTALRSLAPLLPYYDVDPADVQFIGTGRWKDDDVVREPALNGGIFATTDHDAKAAFVNTYDRTYGSDPSRLASLAYDAVAVGAIVADGDPRYRRDRAEDAAGFYGADGFVRFNPDGTPERGLAVYQIRNGRFIIIEPAPTRATGPS